MLVFKSLRCINTLANYGLGYSHVRYTPLEYASKYGFSGIDIACRIMGQSMTYKYQNISGVGNRGPMGPLMVTERRLPLLTVADYIILS